jgi:hypothetical protein
VLGSCNGTLTLSRGTLSWLSEKRSEGFVLKCSEFSYAASNGQLTIKSGAKTFRFKLKETRENEESRSRFQSMVQRISNACPTNP